MTEHHQLILRGLREFAERLRSGHCWVTYEANGKEHWLQYAHKQVNMDWPFSRAPDMGRMQEYFGALGPIELVGWDSDLYATINLANPEIEALALAIGQVFRDLYELGSEYELTYKIEND
jgi:hypothetical protein